MTRIRRLVLGLFATLLLVPGAVQPIGQPAWLLDLSIDLDSPEALATYMLRRFSFRDDREIWGTPERFASPVEFAAKGAGDCDDWAWFAAAALAGRGYPTWLVSVWREDADRAGNTGHMVAAYLSADGWGYVSTEGHVAAQAASVAELAAKVSPDWLGVSIWRYQGADPLSPWNGWRPSVWVANRPQAGPMAGAFGVGPRFGLSFKRGLDDEVRLGAVDEGPGGAAAARGPRS